MMKTVSLVWAGAVEKPEPSDVGAGRKRAEKKVAGGAVLKRLSWTYFRW